MTNQLDLTIANELDTLVIHQRKNEDKDSKQVPKDSLLKPMDSDSLIVYKLTMYENVWRAVFVALIIAGAIAVEKVYIFHTNPSTRDIPKGHWSDFWIAIVAAVIIGLLRFSVKFFLFDTFLGMLSEKRMKSIEEGKKRADQLCKWFFDFCYYSFTTIFGYIIVKDQPFLSTAMFGNGSCSNIFMNYPEVPYIPYLRLFYMIQAGTHLYTFTHQIVMKYNDPKFYEYALHHGLAFFLIWFSYMMNFTLIGVIVLLLHDPSDVILIAARAYTDFKNRILALNIIIYALAYPTWVYTRNIVFPGCVIYQSFLELYSGKHDELLILPKQYMIAMMTALAVMHLYWTYFLTKAAISMLQKGKDKNGYDS